MVREKASPRRVLVDTELLLSPLDDDALDDAPPVDDAESPVEVATAAPVVVKRSRRRAQPASKSTSASSLSCTTCAKSFKSTRGLKRHRTIAHSSSSQGASSTNDVVVVESPESGVRDCLRRMILGRHDDDSAEVDVGGGGPIVAARRSRSSKRKGKGPFRKYVTVTCRFSNQPPRP